MGRFNRRLFSDHADKSYDAYLRKKKQDLGLVRDKLSCPPPPTDAPRTILDALLTYYVGIDEICTQDKNCFIYDNVLMQSPVVNEVFQYVQDYIDGKFQAILDTLTTEKLSQILCALDELRTIAACNQNQSYYNHLITYLLNTITGIRDGARVHLELVTLEAALAECQERSQILNDIDALRAYLQQFGALNPVLPSQSIDAICATIRPEYVIYINWYGFPENSIFDPILLAEIVCHMQNGTLQPPAQCCEK